MGRLKKVDLPSLKNAKQIEELPRRVEMMFNAEDKGGELVRRSLAGLFAYVSNRVPEISDNLYAIDDALRAGFGWDIGPFQYWDIVSLERGIEVAEAQGDTIAPWVKEMISNGNTSFYKVENGFKKYYDVATKSYQTIPGAEEFVILDNQREKPLVYQNSEVNLHDIGDGVLCLEFTSKMNAMGEGILTGIQESIRIAEEDGWKGLVIGNNDQHFTVGANLMLIGMLAFQQEFDEMNMAVNLFQANDYAMPIFKHSSCCSNGKVTFLAEVVETIMHCDGNHKCC